MAFDPVSAALDIGSKLIDRLWPDPAQRDQAKLELLKMQQAGELQVIAAARAQDSEQAEINKIEAASSSVFVAGWRPFVGWTCGAGVAYAFVAKPILAWTAIATGYPAPPDIDVNTLMGLLTLLLGVGGLRTIEKIKGVAR